MRTILQVGPSINRTKQISFSVSLPTTSFTVDRTSWANPDTYSDRFQIELAGKTGKVTRLDTETGWGLNLQVYVDLASNGDHQNSGTAHDNLIETMELIPELTPTAINQIIPKVIYLTYGTELPGYVVDRWQKLHPSYRIEFYDDNRCLRFLAEHYPEVFPKIFQFITDGPIRADFWRVCCLYKFGGYYVDADINPQLGFDQIIEPQVSFVGCLSNDTNVKMFDDRWNPHIIGTVARCPVMNSCINQYVSYYHSNRHYDYWNWSIVTVFRQALDSMYRATLAKQGHQSGVYLYQDRSYQVLKESFETNPPHSAYGGRVIVYNQYETYDRTLHKFKCDTDTTASPSVEN